MNPLNEDRQSLGHLGESLNKLTSELREGGPEVSFEYIIGYIDGVLEPAAMQQVSRNIVTWRAWYGAYWETVGALEDGVESASESSSEETPTDGDAELQSYVDHDYLDLMAELPKYAVAVRSEPLGAYRPALRAALCAAWPQWKIDPALQTDLQLATAVAQALAEASIKMPFPVPLVAAILVKEGLDGLCSLEDLT